MVHYGMHGTCAGSNYEISRDWSGVMCDMLEKDSKAITAFVTGPEGDVGPRLSNGRTTGNRDITYVYEIGNKAALDAVKIYKSIRVYDKSPRLAVVQNPWNLMFHVGTSTADAHANRFRLPSKNEGQRNTLPNPRANQGPRRENQLSRTST
jgi:hypothetical protein